MTAAAAGESAAPDAASGLQPRRRAVAVAAVLSSMALVVLDAGVVNLALPTIAGALQVPAGAAVLVVTAYQAAVLMALLPCGALGERLGYRRVFAAGVALFTAASLLCALAPSLTWLVAARFLQGLGGAAIMSVGVALLRFSVPADRLGSAIGWNAMTIALCSAAGPTVGALVLTLGDWPWLFALNLPLGLGVLLATRALPVTRPGAGARRSTGSAFCSTPPCSPCSSPAPKAFRSCRDWPSVSGRRRSSPSWRWCAASGRGRRRSFPLICWGGEASRPR